MEDAALGPLDLVKLSALKEQPHPPSIDVNELANTLEMIVQIAVQYINSDRDEDFLYKNPNGWKRRPNKNNETRKVLNYKMKDEDYSSLGKRSTSMVTNSSASSDEDLSQPLVPWSLIDNFDFRSVVRQITQYIETWDLSPATKFVVIAQEKIDNIEPFGQRYYVEAHFSKPTPKCPNPLAVARVYFHVNFSRLLPRDYPVCVSYKFEGYRSKFYAMGERKLGSNVFQRYFIDSILHMKLAFYAELYECRNPEILLEGN